MVGCPRKRGKFTQKVAAGEFALRLFRDAPFIGFVMLMFDFWLVLPIGAFAGYLVLKWHQEWETAAGKVSVDAASMPDNGR